MRKLRTDEEILDELDRLVEGDSNDEEIDTLRDIVHELLEDRSFFARLVGKVVDQYTREAS